jgi:hypothetical protein
MSQLQIGIAQVNFTPRIGLPLAGNYRDDYAARGVHDPLYSKAIVIRNSAGHQVALLVLDICVLNRQNTAFMKQLIYNATGIPPSQVLIAATHTHSGPSPATLGIMPRSSDTDTRRFLQKAAGAVGLACRKMKPSSLHVGFTTENRLSYIRRLLCKDGKTHMNWEKLDPRFVVKPLGRIDPQVIALAVQNKDKRRAIVVNFGLHPAVLAGDNWLYSADYPGYLAEAMQKTSGRDLCTLFFNGCCGNVNHIDYSDLLQGRGFQMTQRIGYMLAADTQETLTKSVEVKGSAVRAVSKLLALKRIKISEAKYRWSKKVLAAEKKKRTKGQVDGLPDAFYATVYQQMYHEQHQDDFAEIMVIRVGELGIVGLPGEAFCELGIEIKKKSPAKHTMVIELANDAIGYLPIRKSFKQGGYEPSIGSTKYVPGTGEKIAATAVELLKKLFSER